MPPPGWYPDPASDENIRYWDGASWTDRVQPRTVPPPPGPDAPPAALRPPTAPVAPSAPGPTPVDAYPYGAGGAPPYAGAPYGYAPGPGGPQLTDPYQGYAPAPPLGGVPGRIGPAGQRLSGWWRRVGGYVIDGFIVGIPSAIAALLASMAITAGGGTIINEDRLTSALDRIEAGETLALGDLSGIFASGFWTVLAIWFVVYLALSLLNGVYLVSRDGQTLGDRAIHVRKVMADRTVPTFAVALARWLIPNVAFLLVAQVVPFGFLLYYGDYLWPLWDSKSQTVHDKMVRTFVERSDLVGPPVPRR